MTPDQIHEAEELLIESEWLARFIADLEGATSLSIGANTTAGGISVNAADHPRIVAVARAEAERQFSAILAKLKEIGCE